MALKNIFLTGHRGMVGSAVYKNLLNENSSNVIVGNRSEVDLLDWASVDNFFNNNLIDLVIHVAAKVGGITAVKNNPYDFLYENLQIQNNVLSIAANHNITKLLFIGSSCIYPRDCTQPMREEYLLTGPLERTLEPFALAKICGIKMCQAINQKYGFDYRSMMPSNLYGPNDNYNLKTSHFFPALIAKCYLAKKNNKKEITLWGSGKSKREMMYVDDLADACIYFLHKKTKETLINVGTSKDISILNYAKFILKKLNLNCKIILDKSKPDGTQRKIIDNSIALSHGWKPKINLDDGFELTLKSYFSKSNK